VKGHIHCSGLDGVARYIAAGTNGWRHCHIPARMWRERTTTHSYAQLPSWRQPSVFISGKRLTQGMVRADGWMHAGGAGGCVVAVHHSCSTCRMLLTACSAGCAGLTKEEEGFKDAVAATLLPMVCHSLEGWQARFHR
jgi:hypothetical protein